MKEQTFRSGPSLLSRRPPPRKREGAPGKVRQLKVSAEEHDNVTLRHRAPRCKKTERETGGAR